MPKGLAGFIGLFLALGLPLRAQDPVPTFQFSAFGTLGVAGTDSHQVGYRRDFSQPYYGNIDQPNTRTDSRLGVQLDARISDDLRATFQVVSKYRYDGTYKPDLTWAYLAWNPVNNLDLRAGRLGMDQVLGMESRDVGYSYLWVRPNVAVLGGIPFTSFDGLDATDSFGAGDQGTLKVKVFLGRTVEKVPVVGLPPFQVAGSPIGGIQGEYQRGTWEARLGYTQVRFRNGAPGALANLPPDLQAFGALLNDPGLNATALNVSYQGAEIHEWAFNLANQADPVQVMFELNQYGSDRAVFPTTRSGMVSLGYRLGGVVPFLTFSRAVTANPGNPYLGALPSFPDPYSQLVVGITQEVYHAGQANSSTASAGLRWDWATWADLKVQVDQVRSHSVDGFFVLQPGWNGHLQVYTVTLDFVLGRGR